MCYLNNTIKWFEEVVAKYEGKISTVYLFRDKLQILRAKRAERIGKKFNGDKL